jgi:hypothetical protein
VGLPRLLCDLIAAAFSEDDSVEIRTLPNHATLMTDGVADAHEVVIVGVTNPWHSQLLDNVSRASRPRLFGVRTDGRESWMYRMQPCPVRLGPVSAAQIRAAVLASQDRS